jgi:hypothetical protein
MDIIVSEIQKKQLILESRNNLISQTLKKSKVFAKTVIEKSENQTGLDLRFLLTWGTTIGGIMQPLNEFISGEFPTFNESDISLIIVGVVSIVFFNNENVFNKLIKIIKEKGLFDAFKSAMKKTSELKNVFFNFIESLNITVHKLSNIVSYAFLIPIIPMIYEISKDTHISPYNLELITKRIVSAITVTISGVALKEIISKLLKRFSK